jgi:hypothetical protein
MVVHLALTVDGQFFLVICTHQGRRRCLGHRAGSGRG